MRSHVLRYCTACSACFGVGKASNYQGTKLCEPRAMRSLKFDVWKFLTGLKPRCRNIGDGEICMPIHSFKIEHDIPAIHTRFLWFPPHHPQLITGHLLLCFCSKKASAYGRPLGPVWSNSFELALCSKQCRSNTGTGI